MVLFLFMILLLIVLLLFMLSLLMLMLLPMLLLLLLVSLLLLMLLLFVLMLTLILMFSVFNDAQYSFNLADSFFLYSVNLTEYVTMDPRVSVCVSVCLCVCLCHLYSPNEWTDFDETLHKSPTMNLLNTFFSDFENSNLMTSWRPF